MLPTGAGIAGLQFRPGSQEMLVLRANGDAEVWDAAWPARLAGPWGIGTNPVRAFGFDGPITIVLVGDQGFQLRTLDGNHPTLALDTPVHNGL